MAFLIAKPPNIKLELVVLESLVTLTQFTEMGVCTANDNQLKRLIGFESLEHILENINEEDAALIYLDNHEYKYNPKVNYSPLLIDNTICGAFCGEMLSLTDPQRSSNNKVFFNQQVVPTYKDNPMILESEAYQWLIMKTARSFVGGCFMKFNGSFVFFNKHLFKEVEGIFYMNSALSEKESLLNNGKKVDLSDFDYCGC